MPEFTKIMMDKNTPSSKRNKILKVDKHLPQIIVPRDKAKMFVEWWNTDIRFETSIPHSFEEGYLVVEDLFHIDSLLKDSSVSVYSNFFKSIAKSYHITYRAVENGFTNFVKSMQNVILYFLFIDENKMRVEAYNGDNEIIYGTEFAMGDASEPEDVINIDRFLDDSDLSLIGKDRVDDYVIKKLSYIHISILATCLWYIATSGNHTRYVYENKIPIINSRSKHTVQVSNTKFISTPIYDIGKVRTVKLDRLVARKKGWTYSHSFEVHGHYRHYKNGKVIFIKPFVKGENKEFKTQKIILNPKT